MLFNFPLHSFSGGFYIGSLFLTGWWRANYVATTWTGNNSSGTSGGRTLTSGDTPSAASGAGGYNFANFNGLSDTFASALTLSDFISASNWSIAILIRANSAVVDPGAASRHSGAPALISDTGGFFTISYTDSGVSVVINDGVGARSTLTVPCGTSHDSGYRLVQAKYNGVNLFVRVDDGAWYSQAYASVGDLTGTILIGTNYNQTQFFEGQIGEIIISATTLSDATFDNIYNYIQLRYGQSQFDPSSQSLSVWNRSPFITVPWLGTASLGNSKNIAFNGLNNPGGGPGLNSYDTLLFDGINDRLPMVYYADSMMSGTEYYYAVLFNSATATAASGLFYNDRSLFSDTESNFGVNFTTSGVTAYQYDTTTGWAGTTLSCSEDNWHFVQVWHDGTNLNMQLDNTLATPVAIPFTWINSHYTILVPQFGNNNNSLEFFEGQIAEFIAFLTVPSAQVRANLLAYVNSRYGLSL